MEPTTIFDFSKDSNLSQWFIEDDVVMGGRSSSSILLTKDGYGKFSGQISLENNGGFASIRYRPGDINISGCEQIVLNVKGDGKRYQLRLSRTQQDRHSYIHYFETSGEWQKIHLKLKDFYPTFRGRTLDLENFNKDVINEIGFLIGNKKPQEFELLIDKIWLK
ncbi:CIA30 family protein [Gangjinia marincola]|uniref:CIA30 family protein n=1 Tax=Gangjinia marincola TaxID=578463 RepID=A0ABN1ME67_9FLAO